MSLADELLADLEENDNEELETLIEAKTAQTEETDKKVFKIPAVPMEVDIKNVSIRELAKLRDSSRLSNVSDLIYIVFNECDINFYIQIQVMTEIDKNFDKIPKPSDIVGLIEADPEYRLIVEANNIAADVDSEIGIKKHYNKKFNITYLFHSHLQL